MKPGVSNRILLRSSQSTSDRRGLDIIRVFKPRRPSPLEHDFWGLLTGPYAASSALELVENRRVVLGEVLVDDDVDSGIFGGLGHGYWPPTQYRDLCDVLHLDHGI